LRFSILHSLFSIFYSLSSGPRLPLAAFLTAFLFGTHATEFRGLWADGALAEIIREAHEGSPRIEVHCWVVSHFIWALDYPAWDATHLFNAHPEYLTKDSFGQRFLEKGYFLDPVNPDANQSVHNVVGDIVKRYDHRRIALGLLPLPPPRIPVTTKSRSSAT
jgi:hypothetical protein